VRPLVIAFVGVALGLSAAARGQQALPLPATALRQTDDVQIANMHVANNMHVAYVPDLGDIMETAQLRHFKLSYAGTVKN